MAETVEIVRSRRRTVQLRVGPGGRVEVRAPRSLGDGEIRALLERRAAWIARQTARQEEEDRERARWTFREGSTLLWRGVPFRLDVVRDPECRAPAVGLLEKDRTIRVRTGGEGEPALRPVLLEWLRQQATRILPVRVGQLSCLMGLDAPAVTVRSQKTRWGSCSRRGRLSLNDRLLLVPPEVLDYVVAHELCHRRHFHHGPEFWAELERVHSGVGAARAWLRKHRYLLDV